MKSHFDSILAFRPSTKFYEILKNLSDDEWLRIRPPFDDVFSPNASWPRRDRAENILEAHRSVQRSINLREKHFWQEEKMPKNLKIICKSFGHHQRDKDEKGLSPSRNKKVKEQPAKMKKRLRDHP